MDLKRQLNDQEVLRMYCNRSQRSVDKVMGKKGGFEDGWSFKLGISMEG